MTLLQISEPGGVTEQVKRYAVGIDLGTTNSLVAYVTEQGATAIADHEQQVLLPSVVYYGEQTIQVGHSALQSSIADPANTMRSIKRMMGRKLTELAMPVENQPQKLVSNEADMPVFQTAQGMRTPVQISADILKSLIQRAEQTLTMPVEGAVITVPAYFDDIQRQATKEAAFLAGINVLRLINEPTAAAIAYGLESQQEGVVAVYDLGGGTFDLSILRLNKGVFEVLATAGDTALGGDDFNQIIINWLGSTYPAAAELCMPQHQGTLLGLINQAKYDLSQTSVTTITWKTHQFQITRDIFEAGIKHFVDRSIMICRRALKDAGLTIADIKQVVMVGGSTRVPLVRKKVAEFFGIVPLTSIDPDQVVALGAAIQADILIGNKNSNDLLLLDVIPLSLGIETMGELVEKVIPRNSVIPCAMAQEFTTFKDGQTAMKIHILQGERELVKDCRSLGEFTLRGIPALPAGAAHIRVTFQVDADGLLSVTALENSTGVNASVEIKPSYGLSEEQITNMLTAAMDFAKQDAEVRQLAELKVEALQLIEHTRSALQQDSELLNIQEKQYIEEMLELVTEQTAQDDLYPLEGAINVLDSAIQDFAARRMDKAIQSALTGQSIEEI